MNVRLLLLPVVGTLLTMSMAVVAEEKAKTDADKIVGVWVPVSGGPLPSPRIPEPLSGRNTAGITRRAHNTDRSNVTTAQSRIGAFAADRPWTGRRNRIPNNSLD
jgi:hypothetical protein